MDHLDKNGNVFKEEIAAPGKCPKFSDGNGGDSNKPVCLGHSPDVEFVRG